MTKYVNGDIFIPSDDESGKKLAESTVIFPVASITGKDLRSYDTFIFIYAGFPMSRSGHRLRKADSAPTAGK